MATGEQSFSPFTKKITKNLDSLALNSVKQNELNLDEKAVQKAVIITKAVPWVEKYRPKDLSDLVAHEDIVNTLTRFVFPNRNREIEDVVANPLTARLPHLLLYGPPRTGKTSTILAIAKQLWPTKAAWNDHVLELNASDDRGIAVVQNKIINFVSMRCMVKGDQHGIAEDFKNLKLVILDEADAMTKDAQNALRRIVEKYTKTTRFCFIGNYIGKVIPAIQSRCTKFRFAPLSHEQMKSKIEEIVTAENIELHTVTGSNETDADNDTDTDSCAMKALIKQSQGDMRRALNALQSASLAFNYGRDSPITADKIYATVGKPTPTLINNVFNTLMNENVKTAYELLEDLMVNQGVALLDLCEELHEKVLEYEVNEIVLGKFLMRVSEIEWRLSKGCADEMQIGALIAAFCFLREEQIGKSEKIEVNVPKSVIRSY